MGSKNLIVLVFTVVASVLLTMGMFGSCASPDADPDTVDAAPAAGEADRDAAGHAAEGRLSAGEAPSRS